MQTAVKYPICGLCENFRWITLAPQHGECVVIPGERSPQSDPCDNYRCDYNEETKKSYIEHKLKTEVRKFS